MSAEFVHILNELKGGSCRQAVSKKRLTVTGSDQRSIGTDKPYGKAKLTGDGQGIVMAASGGQDDFDSGFMRCPQRCDIARRHLKIGIGQCAVNIEGQQADGESWHTQSYFIPRLSFVYAGLKNIRIADS